MFFIFDFDLGYGHSGKLLELTLEHGHYKPKIRMLKILGIHPHDARNLRMVFSGLSETKSESGLVTVSKCELLLKWWFRADWIVDYDGEECLYFTVYDIDSDIRYVNKEDLESEDRNPYQSEVAPGMDHTILRLLKIHGFQPKYKKSKITRKQSKY